MARELAPTPTAFLAQVRERQRSFAPESPLVREVEDAGFNYRCCADVSSICWQFLSLAEVWSAGTQQVVRTLRRGEVEEVVLTQQERAVRLARRNCAPLVAPQIGCDGARLLHVYHASTEAVADATRVWDGFTHALTAAAPSFSAFCAQHAWLVEHFTVLTPRAKPMHPIAPSTGAAPVPAPLTEAMEAYSTLWVSSPLLTRRPAIHRWQTLRAVQFPEKRLLQYDCGKLQVLSELLPRLRREGHRCLLFTQMSRMLDIFETFLNMHHFSYLRMDGSTSLPQRQKMMEKFNNDSQVFIFILSTRSGGLGINLVGADTVIFYDSDWNPAMDAQAQDRAHRIGQTRDVHIYRLVSESTVEENILKKANQKRHLSQLSLEEGRFTTQSFVKEITIADIIGAQPEENQAGGNERRI